MKCSDLFFYKCLIFVVIYEYDIFEDKKYFILNIGFWKGMFNLFYFMLCYENLEIYKIGRSVCIEFLVKEV